MSSHRLKCESDLDGSGIKSSKRQKVNYDYEEDSFNDYDDDDEDDESDEDENASEQSMGNTNPYMLLASSANQLNAFGEHNFGAYSSFGFDSMHSNNCGDFSQTGNFFSFDSQSTAVIQNMAEIRCPKS